MTGRWSRHIQIIVVSTLFLFCLPLRAIELAPPLTITANDGGSGDEFGAAVATDGQTIAIGAPEQSSGQGAVYLYTRSGAFQLKLAPTATNSRFGASVAVAGDVLAVGAPGDGSFAGAVYLYTRSGTNWIQRTKLTLSNRVGGEQFGQSVALDGPRLLAGAPGRSTDVLAGGAAYLYERVSTNAWQQRHEFVAEDAASGDLFGWSVDIDAERVVVGAYGRGNDDRGGAYLFERQAGDSWQQLPVFTASDGAQNDNFGYSVAISGTNVLIGAPGRGDLGAAYPYRLTNDVWTPSAQVLIPFGVNAGARFGESVALSSGMAAVGAPGADNKADGGGSIYLHADTGTVWSYRRRYDPPGFAQNDALGRSVATTDGLAVAGSPGDNISRGAAYRYTFDDLPPRILSRTPLNGATGVAVNTSIDITFDEEIQPSALSGTLRLQDVTASSATATLPISAANHTYTTAAPRTSRLSFTLPASLSSNTTYSVQIDSSTIRDASGNQFVLGDWQFATVDTSQVLPMLVSRTPAPNANVVLIDTPLTLTFNETISPGAGTVSLFRDADTLVAELSPVADGNVVSLPLSSPLQNGVTYILTLQADAFRDTDDNPFPSSELSWQFTTRSAYDTDANGAINLIDAQMVINALGQSGDLLTDVNGDGLVTPVDIVAILNRLP